MLIGFMFIVEKSFDFHIVLLDNTQKRYTDKIPTYSTPGARLQLIRLPFLPNLDHRLYRDESCQTYEILGKYCHTK